jgi:hypothetical protein
MPRKNCPLRRPQASKEGRYPKAKPERLKRYPHRRRHDLPAIAGRLAELRSPRMIGIGVVD